ncbi:MULTISPECIES: outer membrane protein assembly factor BamB [Oleiagrimonas]|uniref:Outer membrane protein assembly factor BamB n=1 Tax=Oleiagrimonas citrea TaxID=1665687 RepID=A0A846ZRG3_9GAMM|nr:MULTISPECIES: outer membrane protein assembly factor BamB [Oleiagrimonas]NKZ40210.1 outer membrane protein assembly factor BamB [Oleiagrimonas citrea]RAP57866.1 outer membrane protein assembly factor BamB [Oleiagrimonas sp. MCCC 1A03011]
MKRIFLIAIITTLALGACHSKKSNIQPPTELTDITPTVSVQRVWEESVGDGAQDSGVRMRPAYDNGVLFAASTDGVIEALDAKTGKTLWRKKTRTHGWLGFGGKKIRKDALYAGGPGVGEGLVVTGTLDGHVYAFDAKTGEQRWVAKVSSEVISAPVVLKNITVVRTNDGNVFGLNTETGKQVWLYDQDTVPALSLRGNGPLLVARGVVFFGTDDGKLVAIRLDDGEKLWDLPLATGEGRTDIQRLDDADVGVLLDGSTLYASAYHGELTSIDGPTGRPGWHRKFSTYTSMDIGGQAIVGVDDASDVWAFDKSTGSDLWKQDALEWRWLSAPAVQLDKYVVVGDLKGYVHWLDLSNGKIAARERLSHKAIRAQPLVVGNMVYIEDVEGHIGAYRLGSSTP